MPRNHHILNAASNLLGIALLIIAGLHISDRSSSTLADEGAWLAAICFSLSCLFSYLSLRSVTATDRLEDIADKIFLAGMVTLILSVVVLAAANI